MSSPPLTIVPEPLDSAAAQTLIARLDAELTERYPAVEDRHFELTGEQGRCCIAVDRGTLKLRPLS